MSGADAVLDAIDSALRDQAVSEDAMRSRPAPPVPDRAPLPLTLVSLAPALSTSGPEGPWIPLGSFEDGTLRVRPAAPPAPVDLTEFFRELGQKIAELCRDIMRALLPGCRAAARCFHDLSAALRPALHRRCLTCHPGRKPKPLAVDGHEYRRRQRNRVKRRRSR